MLKSKYMFMALGAVAFSMPIMTVVACSNKNTNNDAFILDNQKIIAANFKEIIGILNRFENTIKTNKKNFAFQEIIDILNADSLGIVEPTDLNRAVIEYEAAFTSLEDVNNGKLNVKITISKGEGIHKASVNKQITVTGFLNKFDFDFKRLNNFFNKFSKKDKAFDLKERVNLDNNFEDLIPLLLEELAKEFDSEILSRVSIGSHFIDSKISLREGKRNPKADANERFWLDGTGKRVLMIKFYSVRNGKEKLIERRINIPMFFQGVDVSKEITK